MSKITFNTGVVLFEMAGFGASLWNQSFTGEFMMGFLFELLGFLAATRRCADRLFASPTAEPAE